MSKLYKHIYLLALLSVMLFSFNTGLYAQVRSDTLNEVKVQGHYKKKLSNEDKVNAFSPGQKISTIDSITLQEYQNKDIGTLLSEQTPVFIHPYGFNSLATLNFRGSSAAQSQVLWNGVPIQNAALGLTDVTLLPVLLMDKVNLVYGSSAALWGSGNVGGALLLEQDKPFFDNSVKKNVSLFAGAGSYSSYMGGLKVILSLRKWYFLVNAFGQTALNDFSYSDKNNKKLQTQNAGIRGGGVLATAAYKIDEKNTISLSAWYQRYYREIPAALFESYSVKNHTDGSLRLLAEWDGKGKNCSWYAKSSFIQDYLRYADTSVALESRNIADQYYQEAGRKQMLNKHSELLLFIPVQISWIHLSVPGPDETKQQVRAAVAGAYELNFFEHKLDLAINARDEIVDNKNVFLSGVNGTYFFNSWFSVKANIQRTYRVPTLNELYYYPGGNVNLKPEQGWNEDGGYLLKLGNNKWKLTHELSAFNREIKDWIIWYGGAIWTPYNIATVHSRGVETDNNLEYKPDENWKFHLGISTSYILATTEDSYVQNDGSIGKQIPYTPRYYGHLNAGFSYRNLNLNYNHSYTGYRFVTVDESEYLEPYNLANLQLLYTIKPGMGPIQLNAQCNNIWNARYQVANGRPMPGINWSLGLKIQLI